MAFNLEQCIGSKEIAQVLLFFHSLLVRSMLDSVSLIIIYMAKDGREDFKSVTFLKRHRLFQRCEISMTQFPPYQRLFFHSQRLHFIHLKIISSWILFQRLFFLHFKCFSYKAIFAEIDFD